MYMSGIYHLYILCICLNTVGQPPACGATWRRCVSCIHYIYDPTQSVRSQYAELLGADVYLAYLVYTICICLNIYMYIYHMYMSGIYHMYRLCICLNIYMYIYHMYMSGIYHMYILCMCLNTVGQPPACGATWRRCRSCIHYIYDPTQSVRSQYAELLGVVVSYRVSRLPEGRLHLPWSLTSDNCRAPGRMFDTLLPIPDVEYPAFLPNWYQS
jgi:hypothetical protein